MVTKIITWSISTGILTRLVFNTPVEGASHSYNGASVVEIVVLISVRSRTQYRLHVRLIIHSLVYHHAEYFRLPRILRLRQQPCVTSPFVHNEINHPFTVYVNSLLAV